MEGRFEDGAVRVDVVEPIWERPAQLDGDQYCMCTMENTQGDFGCGCCWREVVLIARLTSTFRVVWVVEDHDGTLERFEGYLGV